MNGTLQKSGSRYALRFERRLAHAPAKVWRALTESSELAHWFPTDIEGAREAGAELRFVFRQNEGPTLGGRFTTFEPPRLLEYTWGEELLRWELRPEGEGCLLVFTVSFADRARAPRDAAGWHLCLELLEAWLAGRTAAPAQGRWAELHAGYVSQLGLGEFPAFMLSAANRVTPASPHTPGLEGYVFGGIDGNQVAFRHAKSDVETAEHLHETDEYVVVVEGRYALRINGMDVTLGAGQEFFIPRGARISGRIAAGTRTIHGLGRRGEGQGEARSPGSVRRVPSPTR